MRELEQQIYPVHKPTGVTSHAVDQKQEGIVEYLIRLNQIPLFVCQRLDKGTSGIMILARSKKAAAQIGKLFEQRRVKKSYLMVTDRFLDCDQYTIRTTITRQGDAFVSSEPGCDGNAVSLFKRVSQDHSFSLWKVEPETGKPHQIRLHAAQLGMPVLGDKQYGGSPFPRLMLHAQELELLLEEKHSLRYLCRAPRYFSDLSLLQNEFLVSLLVAAERRVYLFGIEQQTAYRLLNHEVPDLDADRFGAVCWFYWYGRQEPTATQLAAIEAVSREIDCQHHYLQMMQNRGSDPASKQILGRGCPKKSWQIEEHGVKYLLKSDQGLSNGIFLDQRQNRLWVKNNSAAKKVLNLFCYTGGFSLCAAAGGAQQVDSVDVSRGSLEWARENFVLNGFEGECYRFFQFDVREFLKKLTRQSKKYDLIICDPPSFARTKEGVFSIKKDLPALVKLLCATLDKGGAMLLSTNFGQFTQSSFEKTIRSALSGDNYRLGATPPIDWDYQLPGIEAALKSVLILSR